MIDTLIALSNDRFLEIGYYEQDLEVNKVIAVAQVNNTSISIHLRCPAGHQYPSKVPSGPSVSI